MTKYLYLLTAFGFLLAENVSAQQFEEDTDAFLPKIMYGEIKSADIDGDGDQDLIVSGRSGVNGNGCTYIYKNDGNANFSLHQSDLPPILFSSIAVGDVDNDGDADLFLSGTWSSNYTGLFKNDGSGHFTEVDPYQFSRVTLGSSVFFDANGDGNLDLFYFGRVSGNTGISKLYMNNGYGQFTDKPVNIEGFQIGSVAAADYDNDGDLDLLISGQRNSTLGDATKLFANDGNGVFTEVPFTFAGVFNGSAVFSDIDNDEDLDIIVNGHRNGVATYHSVFYLNDGAGGFTDAGNRGLDSLSGCTLVLADVDEDGDDDIFLTGRNKAGLDTCALYYNTNGFFTKDPLHYSQGLSQGGALFLNADNNCSPDLIYYGFGDFCSIQTYCFLNNSHVACPVPETGYSTNFKQVNKMTYKVLTNPFRDHVRVEVSEKVFKASVYDVSGRLIHEFFPDSEIIDFQLGNIESGVYNLEFTTGYKPEGSSVRLLKMD